MLPALLRVSDDGVRVRVGCVVAGAGEKAWAVKARYVGICPAAGPTRSRVTARATRTRTAKPANPRGDRATLDAPARAHAVLEWPDGTDSRRRRRLVAHTREAARRRAARAPEPGNWPSASAVTGVYEAERRRGRRPPTRSSNWRRGSTSREPRPYDRRPARCENKAVRRAIASGLLVAFRPARKLLFRELDARAWIESRRVACCGCGSAACAASGTAAVQTAAGER